MQRLVLPAHCLLCAQDGGAQRDLCAGCAGDLVGNERSCPRCALPLATPAPLCGDCLRSTPPFAAAFAPYLYVHPLDLLVTKLKFGRSLAAGRVLSELWFDAIAVRRPVLPDLFVPVPMHTSRLRERGYNQALEIARHLARTTGARLAPEACERARDTPAQIGLPWAERAANVRGAFRAQGSLEGATVAVLDDVMTTGATLDEIAGALKRSGASYVVNWVVARTFPPD